MAEPVANPALYFEPEGFDLTRPTLVGRQVASHGFLRAAVAARADRPVAGYGPGQFGSAFADQVRALDPAAEPQWTPLDQLEALARRGLCHRPDPQLGPEARLRLRVGPQAYALSGVVHTASTVLDQLASLLAEPLTPWDALICPSQSVARVLGDLHGAQADYLRWRFGPGAQVAPLQLPVIPLGVHCDDFVFSAEERVAARAALGLADDEVMALYVGRLSIMTKAHPLPMYLGLQGAAERTGRRLALVQCGRPVHASVDRAVRSGAEAFCPDVRSLFIDGREDAAVRRCWAAADLFVSLSDNTQESFGLTPIEAMAAGLPAVVSDWDGYRETVRDGVDGFRIATWAPQAGSGDHFARALEAGSLTIDLSSWASAASTSVELASLTDRLAALVESAELRHRMGAAGRAHAREAFDWSVIFRRHQALWAELDARRRAAGADELAWLAAAPRASAGAADLFAAFAHYPTSTIGPATRLALAPGASRARYDAVAKHALFPLDPAPEAVTGPLWMALQAASMTAAEAAQASGLPLRSVVLTAGALAKMGLVVLSAD